MLLSFGLGEERLIENMIDVGHLPFHIWTEISPADNTAIVTSDKRSEGVWKISYSTMYLN